MTRFLLLPCPRKESLILFAVLLFGLAPFSGLGANLPREKVLWKEHRGGPSIEFDKESVRIHSASPKAPSGSNRVFSQVSDPTYTIHPAPDHLATGVGIVLCPGGGYRDVWLDREGHDLGIWLQQKGVTTLVLKYRTNYQNGQDEPKYSWEHYLTAITADARRAIQVLRENAEDLHLDTDKIGIAGFSAAGHLALSVTLGLYRGVQSEATLSSPNFSGLFYPWLRNDLKAEGVVEKAVNLPPMFFMNALDDRMTPADQCIQFFNRVHQKGVVSEMHLYSKGGHGFDLAEGKAHSTPLWKISFVAWLKDVGLIEEAK